MRVRGDKKSSRGVIIWESKRASRHSDPPGVPPAYATSALPCVTQKSTGLEPPSDPPVYLFTPPRQMVPVGEGGSGG